mgnify:CR=1 FL=1
MGRLRLRRQLPAEGHRESPALPIIDLLLARGAQVAAFDPVAKATARAALGARAVTLVDSLAAAVDGAEALVLVTRWDEFAQLPALLAARADPPLLVDGRRMIDPASVPRYDGIGR